MTPQSFDQILPPDQDPRLRASEKLVPGEADQVGTGAEALGRRRLVADAAERARAQVVDEGHAMPPRDLGELGELGLLGKAHDSEVRLVHPKQNGGLGPDRALVVGGTRPVRRPHLHEPCAGAREHLGDAKTVPDLDQFASRDHHFSAFGECGEREQHGRGVVVDHESGLGAREATKEGAEMVLARSALPAFEVVLEVRVAGPHFHHPCESGFGQGRTPEIGVHEHAGRVQHTPQRRPACAGKLAQHRIDERAGLSSGPDLDSRALQDRAGDVEKEAVRLAG